MPAGWQTMMTRPADETAAPAMPGEAERFLAAVERS